jgi:hypothetical protein
VEVNSVSGLTARKHREESESRAWFGRAGTRDVWARRVVKIRPHYRGARDNSRTSSGRDGRCSSTGGQSDNPFLVGRVACTPERLPFQDAEADLNLTRPGRIQRQELAANPTGLGGHPLACGRGMDRESVQNDDLSAARLASAESLKQLHELAPATLPADVHHDAVAPRPTG